MEGTRLLKPLNYAIKQMNARKSKKIFILTDGDAEDKNEVKELAAKCPQNTQIHTI